MANSSKGRSTYYTFRVLGALLVFVPEVVARGIAVVSGRVTGALWRGRFPALRANIGRALGPSATPDEIDKAVGEAFSSYARYWVEGARITRLRAKHVRKVFSVEGYEALDEALSSSGAVLALPHLGSWETGGYWLAIKGHPMTTVAEELEPPELFEWMTNKRRAIGLEILPLSHEATGLLTQAIRAGRLVGLVADRDIGGNGVEVELFGETTRIPGGAAALALRTGVPLFVAGVYQRPHGRYHAIVRGPIPYERQGGFRTDVALLTARLAKELESLIALAPTQWHMFQPNWPSEEPAEKDGARRHSGAGQGLDSLPNENGGTVNR